MPKLKGRTTNVDIWYQIPDSVCNIKNPISVKYS